MSAYPYKRRRTATAVLAGAFEPRYPRDVLTTLLNGVPTPKLTEEEQEARRAKRREKKDRQREKRDRELQKRAKPAPRALEKPALPVASTSATAPPTLIAAAKPPLPLPRASSFWQARPQIVIPTLHRSASFSPPPMPSSPPTTPGPSISSRTSATSSKRPYTPDDYDHMDINGRNSSVETDATEPKKEKARKKRQAARKGWKGWVEGSPPPSEKLINLDVATILPERKTRSGKNFDAIGVGKEGWV
ncbi:hypothetical protein C2E23DRAFT_848526 [Lenzites betulinus]|nr:hypothetical protein C2E23DRAFT_848526 [Lenzites betulinus]